MNAYISKAFLNMWICFEIKFFEHAQIIFHKIYKKKSFT